MWRLYIILYFISNTLRRREISRLARDKHGCSLMYICQLCQDIIPARTPAHRFTLKTRPRTYPPRRDANPVSRKRKAKRTVDPGGAGHEIVREITVCPACAQQLAATNCFPAVKR